MAEGDIARIISGIIWQRFKKWHFKLIHMALYTFLQNLNHGLFAETSKSVFSYDLPTMVNL